MRWALGDVAGGAHYAIGVLTFGVSLVTVWLSPGGWEIPNGGLLTQAVKIIEETEKMGNKDLPPGEPLAWVQSDSSDSSCAPEVGLAADNTPSAGAQPTGASEKLSGRQLTKSCSLSTALRTIPKPERQARQGDEFLGHQTQVLLAGQEPGCFGRGLVCKSVKTKLYAEANGEFCKLCNQLQGLLAPSAGGAVSVGLAPRNPLLPLPLLSAPEVALFRAFSHPHS